MSYSVEFGASENTKVEFIESYIKIGNGDYQWHDNHGELIRCKDCSKRGSYESCPIGGASERSIYNDWYCADGKRK